jgi:carbamate kinase
VGDRPVVVAALGGNALLERGEVPEAEIQQHHVESAVAALAPLARDHGLVVTHGNGPQVGMLAIESAGDPALPHPYPFDVLGAETQGMIGYWLLLALANALGDTEVVALICRTLVAPDDPAFAEPTKFVGPVYDRATAERLGGELGWQVRPDGPAWRRVVPSPEPVALVETPTIRRLLDGGAVVVCAGGGGAPVCRGADGRFRGVEAVVDKDLMASLLARQVGAEALLLLTDVPSVVLGFGTDHPRPVGRTTPAALRAERFAAGSMGPKVDAACRFVEATGRAAAIGRLADAAGLLAGTDGTVVTAGG